MALSLAKRGGSGVRSAAEGWQRCPFTDEEAPMRWFLWSTMLTVTLVIPSIGSAADGGPNCTQASLEGDWGFTLSGTVTPAPAVTPAAAVGVFTVDRLGNVSGRDTTSANGAVFPEMFSGTATVNPDCTGSATINSSILGETHFDFVLVVKKSEMILIRKDAGTVVFGSAQKQ